MMKILGGFVSLCLILLMLVSMQFRIESQANVSSLNQLEVITADNASRLEELKIIGRGSLGAATFSPDGRTLVLGTTAGIWIYDFENLELEPHYWNPGLGYTGYLQFDTTGRYLEVGTSTPDVGSGGLNLWEFNQDFTQAQVVAGSLVADGQYIRLEDGSLLNPSSQEILNLNFLQDIEFNEDTSNFAANAQTKLFAFMEQRLEDLGNLSREIRIYDTEKDTFARLIVDEELTGGFFDLTISDDGNLLIAVYAQGTPSRESVIRVWSISDLMTQGSMLVSTGRIIWQSGEKYVASIKVNGSQLWIDTQIFEPLASATEVINLQDGSLIGLFDLPIVLPRSSSEEIFSLKTEDSYEWTLFNETQNQPVVTLRDFGSSIFQAEFNDDGSELVTINQEVDPNWIDVIVRLKTTDNWQTISAIHLHDQIDLKARFQATSLPILVSLTGYSPESQKVLNIWDIRSQSILSTIPIENASSINLSEDGRFLFISAGIERYLYDISQADAPRQLNLPDNELPSIRFTFGSFTPDGNYLILGEYGNNEFLTRFWDIQNEQEVSRIANRQIVTNRFADSISWIDNNQIMVLCEPEQITFWRFQDILETSHAIPFQAMNDGTLCRVSAQDNYVAVPTYGAGIQTRFLTTDIGDTYGVDGGQWWRLAKFSPNGSLLFGFSYFGQMKVWRFRQQESLLEANVSPWQIEGVQFIGNGTLMVLEAEDGTLRLWGVPSIEN